MKNEELLNKYGFEKESPSEFVRDNWTVRIDKLEFELFSDPEIDTRYYHGYLDKLEACIKAI